MGITALNCAAASLRVAASAADHERRTLHERGMEADKCAGRTMPTAKAVEDGACQRTVDSRVMRRRARTE
jgi:hypothetical protein